MIVVDWSNWLWDLLRIGLPSVGAAVGLFKLFGDRWISSHFERQLQNLKHEQQKELENVRLSIQLMHGRVSKIHEREFEVLPKAWFLLQQAHGWTSRTVAIYKEYPDLKLLSDEKLEELMLSLKFTPAQRAEIMASSKRQSAFVKAHDGSELDSTRESLRLLGNYIVEHQIFMNESLRTLFLELCKILTEAVNDHCFGSEHHDGEATKRCHHTMESIGPKVQQIEQLIQKRLHYEEA